MTTYEERIERAEHIAGIWGKRSATRAIVAAFLGDDEVYVICPDCNGNGQVGRWEASGAFPEECSCRTGFVPLGGGDS